jgi:hypothetical protein
MPLNVRESFYHQVSLGSSRLGGREQRLLDDHQIGEGEQGVELCSVLGQPAIAQLLMAEEVLDNVKGVLDPGPHLRQRPLFRLGQIAQRFWQGLDDAALDGDVPRHRALGVFGAPGRPGVAGIGEDRFLLAVQDYRHLVDVGLVGGGAGERVDHTAGGIHPDMRS